MRMVKIGKIIFLLTVSFLVVFISGCGDDEGCEASVGEYVVENGKVLLDKEGTISCDLCDTRGLHDKIIVLESKYCGACKVAKPLVESASEKVGVEVLFLDVSESDDRKKMEDDFKVMPYYTPTMIVDCEVYVGGKSEEGYEGIFESFLVRQK